MDSLAPLSFRPLRFSRNPIAYVVDAAPDTLADRAALSYVLRLETPKTFGSGEFTELVTLPGREVPPRQEFGATVYPGAAFDVAVYLDDDLHRTPPMPDQGGFVACAGLITPFLVQTCILQNGTLVPDTKQTFPLEYALKGALSVEQFASWRDDFFTSYLADTRQFLTWQPARKWVETDQPEFLYHLVNYTPKPTELRLRVAVTYTDGTSEVLTPMQTANVAQYTVYSVPVGFVALGLPQQEALTKKTVLSYQVWLSNEANARLSEVRTYWVNREYQPNVLYLLLANSLGGFDTLRCTGASSRRLLVRGTDIQRPLDPNYRPGTAEFVKLNRRGERTLTVATGLRDGAELDYLSELLFAEEVYLVSQDGYVALTLAASGDTALELRGAEEDLAGRVLTFGLGKTEVGYSALPVAPPAAARPTRWVPVNTFCLINEQGIRSGLMGAVQLEQRYVDDFSLVKPRRVKLNVPGTEGYQAPVPSAVCAATPFTNARIEQTGRYARNNCGEGQEGGPATLVLEAGSIGAENAEQLAARVASALAAMDTQAYANQYGSCALNPKDYVVTVPPGYFHFRTNLPDNLSVFYDGTPAAGNAWHLALDPNNPDVWRYPKNNVALPLRSNPHNWLLLLRADFAGVGEVLVYRNGLLISTRTLPLNAGMGYVMLGAGETVATGDRLFIEVLNLRTTWY
ncbi:hypothetical protein ACAW74_04925 [Fibrella sp. WM1]|uniref:DUF5977 domain-containing protein n=1 Tax=Fibrella musci TaxID=3242485 RepID=UPI0035218AD3